MIKSELIQRIAASNGHLYQRDVERIVNIIFGEIVDALARGDRVELRGFGAFTVKYRAPRKGRNPRTGDPVFVDEKFVPFFKTGKELRERLNRGYVPKKVAKARAGAGRVKAPARKTPARGRGQKRTPQSPGAPGRV